MTRYTLYFISIVSPVLLFFGRCGPSKNIYSTNEHLYKKSNYELGAKFIVYHLNDSISQLFFSLSNENLVYKRPDTSSWFYAQVKVKYTIAATDRPKQITDSGSVWLYDRQTEKVNSVNIYGSLSMKVRAGQFIVSSVDVYDLNKKVKNNKLIDVDKTSRNTRQNFLMQDANKKIIYDYYLHPGDDIYISSQQNQQSSLRVDYFYREFPLAPPPFSLVQRNPFQYKPDSTFIIEKNDLYYKITIPEKGFFHIITNSQSKEGLTLFSVENAFPGIKNETEMIKSTRYIMASKEYEACLDSPNKKDAIDHFWKEIGGSNERARELLKKYYMRILEANKLFTSFQAGWQSDRGMIYIVFGAPNTLYKSASGEQWLYGNEAQPNSIRFSFKKIVNPFSDNDFTLERSEYYKEPWHLAVTYWREGHIYLDN